MYALADPFRRAAEAEGSATELLPRGSLIIKHSCLNWKRLESGNMECASKADQQEQRRVRRAELLVSNGVLSDPVGVRVGSCSCEIHPSAQTGFVRDSVESPTRL